jgi:hypothetical protein
VKPSPETLYKNPHLISYIGPKSNKPKQLKMQIKALQEVYRYVRYFIAVGGRNTLNILLSKFTHYHPHLKYVDYIENTVVYLPPDHFPRFVQLEIKPFLSTIERYIQNYPNLNSTYALISSIIWNKAYGTKPILPSSLVFKSAKIGMAQTTWKSHADNMKIKYQYKTIKGIEHPIIQIILKSVRLCRKNYTPSSKQRIQPQLVANTDLENQFNYHKTYYPKSSFVLYNELFPMIYFSDDGKSVSIPLIEGIAPIILLCLADYDNVMGWFKRAGKTKAYKLIRTLERDIEKAYKLYLNTSNYLHPRAAFNRYDIPRLITEYSIDNVIIMDTGIPINIPSFKAKTISIKNNAKNPQKDLNERLDERDTIINNANKNGGFCKGYTTLKSASGRTYYRHFNITGFRSEFKDIVELPGRELWYFDVVANDLSILFNISGDQNGLDCLYKQDCPYKLIVTKASKHNITVSRDAVKKFINPYLYGATIPTIVKNSKGVLNKRTANQIKQIVIKTFPQAIKWREDVIKSVSTNELISNKLNPFKDGDIPMPKKLARRTACSIIIQRMGAEFMRMVIQYIMNYSSPKFDVSAYVHDSLLLIPIVVLEDVFLDSHIAEALRYARSRTTGLKLLNVLIGHGNTWQDADTHSKTEHIFTVK